MNLAMDQINRRHDILGNSSLQLIHQCDGCDEHLTAITVTSFVTEAYSARGQLAGVIGPGCSSSTAALAPLTTRSGLEVVTVHDAGSPTFGNRSNYPFHLGVLGSTETFVQGFSHLIRKTNWTRIAILYDASRQYFINTKRLFLEQIDIEVKYLSPVSCTHIPLEDIQQRMLRVIFILAPISLARNIMCRAYNLSMTFNKYQYVLMSARLEDFSVPVEFYYNDKPYECSTENLRNGILNRSFLLLYNLLPKPGKNLVSNMTYEEYTIAYGEYRENHKLLTGRNSTESHWATNLYDAVWAWALVLDKLIKENENFKIQYGDRETSDSIVKQFYQLNFEGMSGTMAFDNNTGIVKREVVISQVQESQAECVAIVGPEGEVRCNESEECNSTIMFIPDYFDHEVVRESHELATFFLLITMAEFFIVIVLHIATLANQKVAEVKASSLKLQNISYAGTYIFISGTFLWTLFSAASINIQLRHYFCQLLWAWTIPIGFSLSFGPVVMKTWRLYRIFEHYHDPGPFISTPYMMAGTLFVTFINLVVSVTWTASDSYDVKNSTLQLYNNKSSYVVRSVVQWRCTCHFQAYWLTCIGILFLALLSVGTVLAHLTRKISNVSFATSSLRVFMYLMSIVIVLGASIYGISVVVPENDRMSYYSFTTICVVLNTVISLFIVCVFSPPLLPLAKKC